MKNHELLRLTQNADEIYNFILDAAVEEGWQKCHDLLSKIHGREINYREACRLQKEREDAKRTRKTS